MPRPPALTFLISLLPTCAAYSPPRLTSPEPTAGPEGAESEDTGAPKSTAGMSDGEAADVQQPLPDVRQHALDRDQARQVSGSFSSMSVEHSRSLDRYHSARH